MTSCFANAIAKKPFAMPPAFTIHIHKNIKAEGISQPEARCTGRVGQENIRNCIIKICEHSLWESRRAQSAGSLQAVWTKQSYFSNRVRMEEED